MIRLIINADDFGISHQVNEAIIKAYNEGIVTSTTLLTNGKGVAEAVRIAKDNNLNVGIHLNLWEGRPITTDHEKIASLVDSDGNFVSGFRAKCLKFKISYRHIYHELENQVKFFLSLGLIPSHIDSHFHVHTLPLTALAVKRLSTKYQIQSIRRSRDLFWPAMNLTHRVAKNAYKRILNSYFDHHFTTTNFFFGVDLFSGGLEYVFSSRGFKETFLSFPGGTYELMCHPNLSGQGKEELDVLTSKKAKKMLVDSGIELISFNELQAQVLRETMLTNTSC